MDNLVLQLLWPTPTAGCPPPRPLAASLTHGPAPDLDASPIIPWRARRSHDPPCQLCARSGGMAPILNSQPGDLQVAPSTPRHGSCPGSRPGGPPSWYSGRACKQHVCMCWLCVACVGMYKYKSPIRDIHICMVPSWFLTQSQMAVRWDHVAQKIRQHGVEGSVNGVKKIRVMVD